MSNIALSPLNTKKEKRFNAIFPFSSQTPGKTPCLRKNECSSLEQAFDLLRKKETDPDRTVYTCIQPYRIDYGHS